MLLAAPPWAWGAEQLAPSQPPAWIHSPDKPGYLSVVGSAQKQEWGGRDAQYRVALMKARQELAQIIRTQVSSSSQVKTEERDGKVTRDVDIELKLQSSVDMQLDAARVIEEWSDPQTGNLYIWLTTPNQ